MNIRYIAPDIQNIAVLIASEDVPMKDRVPPVARSSNVSIVKYVIAESMAVSYVAAGVWCMRNRY